MKKIFITVIAISLLAFGCSKKQDQVQTGQNPPVQNQQDTSTPQNASSTTTAKPPTTTKPLTLSVYIDSSNIFKLNYTSNFTAYNSAALKAGTVKNIDTASCNLSLGTPSVCFIYNDQTVLKNTNLVGAALAVRKLSAKTDIGQCGTFTASEINGGHQNGAVQIGSNVFVTAVYTDAGAGNFYETHLNRTYHNNSCYEIEETVHWTNAQNFSPARQEFDKPAIWQSLDSIRGGFNFVK